MACKGSTVTWIACEKKMSDAPSRCSSQRLLNFKAESSSSTQMQEHYGAKNVQQQELTDAVVDLIADSMVPLQLVETRGFRKFM